jgi:hypothetical protein
MRVAGRRLFNAISCNHHFADNKPFKDCSLDEGKVQLHHCHLLHKEERSTREITLKNKTKPAFLNISHYELPFPQKIG